MTGTMEVYRELMTLTGRGLDAVGVCVIVFGAVIASVRFAARPKIRSTFRTSSSSPRRCYFRK